MKCIILAGGSGERLWPISRELYPKSLLSFFGEKSLVQNAYELALSVTSEKNILTITNIRQFDDTRLQLKKIAKNPVIIAEPMSKNTAPAVASALTFLKSDKDEFIIIMPVDFNIKDKELFKEAVNQAKNLSKKGYITAFGAKPQYTENGFGYIETGENLKQNSYKIAKFQEKPSLEDAEIFTNDGKHLWNTGIYAGKISAFLNAFDEYAKEECKNFSKEMFDENNKIKYEYYENIPEKSFDYAIMESADNTAVVELQTEWTDYGSWHAVYNNGEKDSKKNIKTGNVILNKVKNSFVFSSKELVTASNISDTIIVETEDAVLVCDKSRAADISRIVKELKKRNNSSVFSRKTVFRPWGFYTCMSGGTGWLSKIITVAPGHKLSLQSHNYRSEHWVVLEGTATVILEDETLTLTKRQSVDIPLKAKHSLQNHTNETLKILEVQKGNYIGEDDIIRYEDMYGRIK